MFDRLHKLALFCLLASFVLAGSALAYEPGPYEDPTKVFPQTKQAEPPSNPRADFWRQVREGMPGRVNIPDQDKGVLIRQGGNDWLSTRSNVVANYGRQVIGVALLLTLMFLFFTGRIKVLVKPVSWAVDKLMPLQKPSHWIAAGCFVLLGTTGLNILYGKRVLSPLLGREAFGELALLGKAIHNQASWVFMAAIAIVMILKAREYMPGFVTERMASRPVQTDFNKVGLSEKVLFWFAVVGTLIVAYSGSTLLFPRESAELHQMQLFQLMHSFSALTLTGLIVGNVYLIAIGIRENARNLLQAKEVLEEKVQSRTQELQLLNKKLQTEIQERRGIEAELKVARDVAEQANHSKDKFLATASHDLLQPITAARLMVSTLRMRDLRKENRKVVDQVHVALKGTETLLTDLLDISRLDASAMSAKPKDLWLHELMVNLDHEFQPLARKHNLRFKVRPMDLFVHSDPKLLVRVLRNFITNALRYTQSGGVLVGARRRHDKIRLEVWDSGPGIAPDQRNKIFEEFHRLENKIDKSKPIKDENGAGLGLAIVDRISQVLDHDIGVNSKPGRGSVFWIDVPLGIEASSQGAAPVQNTLADSPSDLSGIVVALVDNDANVLKALETYLREWGCTVLAGHSGPELMDQLSWSPHSPDIIIADYHLDDGIVGTSVVEQIHRVFDPNIPAVIISADHTPERRSQLKDAGYKYLSKPIRPAKIRALLAHLAHVQDQDLHRTIGI